MTYLRVNGINVFYGYAHILKDLTMSVDKDTITAVIGPNGAGKTTLAKTIMGLLKPRSGSITFNGEDITGKDPYQIVERGIVMVPEGRGLFPRLSVYDNLRLAAFTKRAREHLNENLERVFNIFPRLKERINQKSGTLSGGEQQMLAIARALIAEPKVLIIDEASLGLAPKLVDLVFEKIKKIHEEENITIISIEQNAFKALQISDYVYVIEMGRVIKSGEPEELFKDPELRKVYLGI
jgi:branched-chain amino acid transport system ATP-binding protein